MQSPLQRGFQARGFLFMSIESKHKYRFGFLKSEKWSNFRLEVLVKAGGSCFVCGDEHFSNDVHHIVYPDVWDETQMRHVAVLCRDCHNKVHFLTDGRSFDSDGHKWKYFHAVVSVLRDSAIKNWEMERQRVLKAEAQKALLFREQREKLMRKFASCRQCEVYDDTVKKVNVFEQLSVEWIVNLCSKCEWDTIDFVAKMVSEEIPVGKKYSMMKRFWNSKRISVDSGREQL